MADSGKIEGWVVKLAVEAAAEACGLRLFAGVEVAEAAGSLWLRGRGDDAAVRRQLLRLPAAGRYAWISDGRLRPEGSLLATERMPELAWASLRAWAKMEPPAARLPAALQERTQLRLVHAVTVAPSSALMLEFSVWHAWALQAPVARLERLVFAASANSVLVRGTPIPAAPGRHFVEDQGVLIPAGMACEPAVSAAVLRKLWSVGDGDVVVWDEAGLRVFGRELFVPATRANVRATARAIGEEAPP